MEITDDTAEYRKGWEDGLDRAATEMRERAMFDAESVVNEVPRVPPPLSDEARLMLKELNVVSAREKLAIVEAEVEALRARVKPVCERWTEPENLTDYQPVASLSREQRQAANDWTERHDASKHGATDEEPRDSGAIGGAYTWRFTATGLGTVSKLHCVCGDCIDVTDYKGW